MNLFSAPMRAEMRRTLPPLQWFVWTIVVFTVLGYCENRFTMYWNSQLRPYLGMTGADGTLRYGAFFSFCKDLLYPSGWLFLILVRRVVLEELRGRWLDNDFLRHVSSADLFKLRFLVQGFAFVMICSGAFLGMWTVSLGWSVFNTFFIYISCQGLFNYLCYGFVLCLVAYGFYIRFPRALRSPLSIIPLAIAMEAVSRLQGVVVSHALIPPYMWPINALMPTNNMIMSNIITCAVHGLLMLFILAIFILIAYPYIAPRFKRTFYGDEDTLE
jgi:hypothetical protein